MKVLIIAATEGEILPFIQSPDEQRSGIDVLVTGVGMVATAFALGQKLVTANYDLLLNVGIAGSFDRAIALGEVVYVYQDTLAELGAEDGEQFMDSVALGLAKHTFQGALIPSYPVFQGLRQCCGITVNTVHGHERTIDGIIQRLNPTVESMEGAAVFYAAHQAGLPAMQIRAISNYVERRNKASWQIPLAIENLNRWLTAFVHSINR
ncbi:futalosine hydrolase [Parapedobacter koreensis]|uniref:Futalosine hydrolase n=1 Tax=Parapedobacter koreensis TaxID=332977 RepID=A0A1H7QQ01_9SPHI|nr:futalosine hydrolase [Parapedobacter koreensis]SEL50056.1 futalosine hydrolase [Parapedobacter koreensis]